MSNTDTMPRTEVIHVRVTPEQKQSIRAAADAAQRSIGAWCALYLAAIATGVPAWAVR